ncbi:MAG TPA: GNAT family N-acetyltransferase [Ktedonobacterales bacterium]|nr:GNAT family N-acetyltransferase [Ktedonobacterales bacterium]
MIDDLGTHPDFQRRGLGVAALLAGTRWMREQGAEQAMLVTSRTNMEAQRLYEKLGFATALRELVFTKQFS